MYLSHFLLSTVAQNCLIPSISCSLVIGFTSLLINSLSSCQRFSIGLRSGDSATVFHQFTPSCCKKFLAKLDRCLGSLSCMNRWPVGNLSLINGSKPTLRISTKSGASIMPSKMMISLGPLRLMPAHTWTLMGCLALFDKITYLYYCTYIILYTLACI